MLQLRQTFGEASCQATNRSFPSFVAVFSFFVYMFWMMFGSRLGSELLFFPGWLLYFLSCQATNIQLGFFCIMDFGPLWVAVSS